MPFQDILDNNYVVVTSLGHFKAYSKQLRQRFNGDLPFRLSKTDLPHQNGDAGILIPKYSPLQDLFVPAAMRLREAGIIDKISNTYLFFWYPPEQQRELKPIGWAHMASAAFACIIGLALAFMAFIGEMVSRMTHNEKTKRKNRIISVVVQPII